MNDNNIQLKILNIILIIIIIIILFVRCSKPMRFLNKQDIYNIEMSNKKDNCQLDKQKDNGNIIIEDNNGDYQYQKEINIFNDSINVIAPGISGIYYFKVKNNSNINIKYLVKLNKISDYNIKLQYRLKRNNDYIVGNYNKWVDIENLKTTYLFLEKGEFDNYSLEWFWFDNDELDNYIGKSNINNYKVKISFYMEETDNI